jgi:DNA-binding PadR family transcriptional regulator
MPKNKLEEKHGSTGDRRGKHARYGGGRGFSGRGGVGRHHEHRIFDHGEVRYVIVALLAKKASHGYELIKDIEDLLSGAYSPSPGLVYPTLTMLEEMGFATSETGSGGKKLYSLTTEGKEFHKDNKALIESIFARMARAADLHGRAESPQIVRAIQNLRLTLKLKSSAKKLTDTQIRAIAVALDEAAKKIEQC